MIKKYRPKNDTIKAVLYDGSNYHEVNAFTRGATRSPRFEESSVYVFELMTPYGNATIYPGMYIYEMAHGGFMALGSTEFENRYEEVWGSWNR